MKAMETITVTATAKATATATATAITTTAHCRARRFLSRAARHSVQPAAPRHGDRGPTARRPRLPAMRTLTLRRSITTGSKVWQLGVAAGVRRHAARPGVHTRQTCTLGSIVVGTSALMLAAMVLVV